MHSNTQRCRMSLWFDDEKAWLAAMGQVYVDGNECDMFGGEMRGF